MPVRGYDALSRRFKRRFVQAMTAEIIGVRQRCWNAERFIIFQTVALQRARHVIKSCEIRQRINQSLDIWEAGEYKMLVEDKTRICAQYLSTSRGDDYL